MANKTVVFAQRPVRRAPLVPQVPGYIVFAQRAVGSRTVHARTRQRVWRHPFVHHVDGRVLVAASSAAMLVLSIALGNFGYGPSWLQANILTTQVPAFDGTVDPIATTMDWVSLSESEFADFKSGRTDWPSNKLIPLPAYNAAVLSRSTDSIATSSAADRNAFATYVTAYMGKYTGGYEPAIEYAGSHVGVDIRAPRGTPVRAVANGVVQKITSSDGSVSILHPNVPNPSNPNQLQKFSSVYMHMDTTAVTVGQVVRKGDVIGTVGSRGISTTYHLHFQVDAGDAPYSPYWPFTWSDVKVAGTDFFNAVNIGLGADAGRKYTVHPMQWLTTYRSASGGSTTNVNTNTGNNTSNGGTTGVDTVPTDGLHGSAPDTNTGNSGNNSSSQPAFTQSLDISLAATGGTAQPDKPYAVQLRVRDGNGKAISALPGALLVTVDPSDAASVSPRNVYDLSGDGTKDIMITASRAGTYTVKVSDGTNSGSTSVTVATAGSRVASLGITTPAGYVPGAPTDIVVRTLAEDGQQTTASLTSTVQLRLQGGEGTIEPNVLTAQSFTSGQATVRATITSGDSVQIVAEGGYTAQSTAMGQRIFSDVAAATPYSSDIIALKNAGVIGGYPDGTFRPTQGINRAEAVKILVRGLGLPEAAVNQSFSDVPRDAWFQPYVLTAAANNAVGGYPDGTFRPERNINRAEFMKVVLELTRKSQLEGNLPQNAYSDVAADAWFAKYAAYTKKAELLPTDGLFYPGQDITRGEVAHVLNSLIN